MSVWEFSTAGRILFAEGALARVGALGAELGARPFLFVGNGGRFLDRLEASLRNSGLTVAGHLHVPGEPDIDLVSRAVEAIQSRKADSAIAVGGGSVIDTAKAACALTTNPGNPFDYLEIVGRGLPLSRRPLPMIACPTTSGTGSEVTRNAVLTVPDRRLKVSLRSRWMLPTVAIIDPETTLTLSAQQTAWCGMDALTQLVEPFLSRAANPLTDAVCKEGLRLVAKALPLACADGKNLAARTAMSAASLMGGLALANAKLGAVHGLAGALGGMFKAPHGALCGVLLCPVFEANLAATSDGKAIEGTMQRFEELGALLCGTRDPGAALRWLRELAGRLLIPRLSKWGVSRNHFAEIIVAARQSSSMKGNPCELSESALESILEEAL